MIWRDVIKLGKPHEIVDKGEVKYFNRWTQVYANRKSVRSKEFYDSRLVGLKPELMFEIRSFEYDGHEKVKYNNKVYVIIRTYDKGETMELIVSSFIE